MENPKYHSDENVKWQYVTKIMRKFIKIHVKGVQDEKWYPKV